LALSQAHTVELVFLIDIYIYICFDLSCETLECSECERHIGWYLGVVPHGHVIFCHFCYKEKKALEKKKQGPGEAGGSGSGGEKEPSGSSSGNQDIGVV
jgi:hypothetical protein